MHENPPASKYGHVEYNPELFNPQQFDYGFPEDNSPAHELCGEHIPVVSSTSVIPSVISQRQKKNNKIKKLKVALDSYKKSQEEKYLLVEKSKESNEQLRIYNLKHLHNNIEYKIKGEAC